MPTATAEQTLGEFFGSIALRTLVEKKLFGGYQVPFGPLMTHASFWMFQVGSVLGRALGGRLPVLVKMLSMTADGPDPEKTVSAVLCKLAVERMEGYGRQPTSLHDFWLKTEFSLDLKDMSIDSLKGICRRKIPLDEVHYKLDEWLSWGIGFGVSYPQLLENLWAKTFANVDEEVWGRARCQGLALPERPTPLPLKEAEDRILVDTAIYAQKNFPELLDSLGLRERLPHAR